jgi:SAM-dependent methyltransferase
MIDKIRKIFRKGLPASSKGASNVSVKEDSELDFWINVWNKNIIEKVRKETGLNPEDERFEQAYDKERVDVANGQLSGILWMAKKPAGYLDGKVVVEMGPGCNCALEVSNARVKIAIEPIAERYRDNNLLLRGNDSVVYLNVGSEKIPLSSNFADVFVASNCLDHVDDIDATIKEIYRVLKPGGEFFLNVEINHEPTDCEPYALKYQDVVDLFRSFETEFINQMKNPDGREWVRAVFRKPRQ